jgi:hypothetical protein
MAQDQGSLPLKALVSTHLLEPLSRRRERGRGEGVSNGYNVAVTKKYLINIPGRSCSGNHPRPNPSAASGRGAVAALGRHR